MLPYTADEPLVPYHWTTHQARAVVEFLDALADRIWSLYGFAITAERYPFPGPGAKAQQLSLPFPSLWEQGIDMDGIPDDDTPF